MAAGVCYIEAFVECTLVPAMQLRTKYLSSERTQVLIYTKIHKAPFGSKNDVYQMPEFT